MDSSPSRLLEIGAGPLATFMGALYLFSWKRNVVLFLFLPVT